MYFLEQQQAARRLSKVYIWQFVLVAVLGVISVFFTTLLLVAPLLNGGVFRVADRIPAGENLIQALHTSESMQIAALHVVFAVGCTLLITCVSVWLRTRVIRKGDKGIAKELRASRIDESTKDAELRRLLHVSQEMAIAAGIPPPRVYCWRTQVTVNAIAVGNGPANAAIFVSRNAVRELSREELQSLVAYAFGQILNGDCTLNAMTSAYFNALRWPARVSWHFIMAPFVIGDEKIKTFLGWILVLLWLGLLLAPVTMPQYYVSRWLQRRIGNERQRLADATALQFTRNPLAFINALIKASLLSNKETLAPVVDDLGHASFVPLFGRRPPAAHQKIDDRIRAIDSSMTEEMIRKLRRATVQDFERREEALKLEERERRKALARDPHAFATPAEGLVAMLALEQAVQFQEEYRSRAELKRQELDLAAREARTREELSEAAVQSARVDQERRWRAMARLRDTVAEHARPDEARDPSVNVLSLLVDRAPEKRQGQVDYLRPRLGDTRTDALIRAIHSHKALLHTERVAVLEAHLLMLRELAPAELRSLRELVRDLEQLDDHTDPFEYALARMADVFLADVIEKRAPHGDRRLAASSAALQVVLSVLAQFTAKQQAQRAFTAGLARIRMSGQLAYAPQIRWMPALDRALKALESLMPGEKQALIEAARAIVEFDRSVSETEHELLRVIAAQLHCPMPRLEAETGIPR